MDRKNWSDGHFSDSMVVNNRDHIHEYMVNHIFIYISGEVVWKFYGVHPYMLSLL